MTLTGRKAYHVADIPTARSQLRKIPMASLNQHVRTLLNARALWRLALLVSVAAIVYLATTSQSYPIPASANDKVNHLIAFLELTLLTRLAWPELKPWWFAPALLSFGLGIEMVQANLPYRDFSLADLAADAAGIAIGLLPWPFFKHITKQPLRNSPNSL